MLGLTAPPESAKKTLRAAAWLLAASLLCCGAASAQTAQPPPQTPAQPQVPPPAPALGTVIGGDISVVSASNVVTNGASQPIEFTGGSTIVVHTGKARVDLTSGGQLDVCGPAKFTVLASGDAITVALSFGRVHLRFDALRPIVVYTPLIVATLISLAEQPKIATIGLTNAGAMCVLAADGAVRLQNQLTGDLTIVPEPTEVLVPNASFTNFPTAPGQCRCDFDDSPVKQPPSTAQPSAPAPTPAASPEKTAPPAQQSAPVAPAPTPIATPQTQTTPPAATPKPPPPSNPAPVQQPAPSPPPTDRPAAQQSILKATLPPIGYDAKSPTPTPEPLSVATLLLAQEAVVQPAWIFHGTVVGPVNSRKGKKGAAVPDPAPTSTTAPKPKKGFWARFRDFLIGKH